MTYIVEEKIDTNDQYIAWVGLGWFELNETTNTNSILDRIFISLTLVIK